VKRTARGGAGAGADCDENTNEAGFARSLKRASARDSCSSSMCVALRCTEGWICVFMCSCAKVAAAEGTVAGAAATPVPSAVLSEVAKLLLRVVLVVVMDARVESARRGVRDQWPGR